MPTVIEKDITLDFPAGWQVVKYDGDIKQQNASFYREKIEHQVQNVRGVDVVCLTAEPSNRLLLIEVKDYRKSATSAEKNIAKLRQTIIQKALNTISGLYVAARTHDAELYLVVNQLFQPELIIEIVLFLEQAAVVEEPRTTRQKFEKQNPKNAINDLRLDLKSTLNNLGLEFYLRSNNTMQLQDGWSTRMQ